MIYESSAIDAALDAVCVRLDYEVEQALDRGALLALADLARSDSWVDRTGTLRASFVAAGAGAFARTVSNDTPYAGFLEHGTSRIRPRRFMQHASDVVAETLAEELGDAVNRAIRG